MRTLVFSQMYFLVFKGNVRHMAVTRKRPYCERINMCQFVLYIL